jgi:CheY-like chemotaxis protein
MHFSAGWEHARQRSARARLATGDAPVVLLIGGARPRATYRSILSQGGYDIVDAADAGEGLGFARRLRPNLILVELGMPIQDGWELNRMLKSDLATYLIPVVAASLSTQPAGTYHRARSAGFVDYIARPIERRHVLELVAAWARPPARATS